jgi:hypothetical protein
MLNFELCSDGKHVFTWTSSSTNPDYRPSGYCQCGSAFYDAREKRITLTIPGYNPYAPSRPPTPPAEACDVPLPRFRAAQRVGAHCLSADGQIAYTSRYGEVLQAKWQEWPGEFGAWEPTGAEDFPVGAVRM